MATNVFFSFGNLEGLENLIPNPNCIGKALKTWRELLEFVMPEVAVADACSQDKVLVRNGHVALDPRY